MDRDNAIQYITQKDWRFSKLGLERVEELLHRMGDPHKKMQYVHIAGTNGKSSISCMTARILTQAGYKTGLYTSPYVNCFNERMQVDGELIPDEELAAVTAKVRGFADGMEDHPTEFELVTVVAFEWFYERGCDIVALEVGLGGRLDATNVIPTPQLAIITTIDFDHTDVLGDTLEQIAAEKAGVIKPGGDVLLYPQRPQVQAVMEEACQKVGARLHHVDLSMLVDKGGDFSGQTFDYGGLRDLRIQLLGPYQPKNAATVVAGMRILGGLGWKVDDAAIREGLARASWPARFELVNKAPAFIVDGGHNPQCVLMLVEALEKYFPGKKVTFITGVMADKDYKAMFDKVIPMAKRVLCVTPDNPRALPAEELARFFQSEGVADVTAWPDVQSAVTDALAHAAGDDVICAFGSFYMAGDIRRRFCSDSR